MSTHIIQCMFLFQNNKSIHTFFFLNEGILSGATVITLCIGTPYLLTILVLKFEVVQSTTS